jgi:hypothetical protein
MFLLFGTHPSVALTALMAGLVGLGNSQVAAVATQKPPPQLRDHRPRDTAARYDTPKYIVHAARADAVRQAFQISWDGYYKYAFPHDSLRPTTNGYYDDR